MSETSIKQEIKQESLPKDRQRTHIWPHWTAPNEEEYSPISQLPPDSQLKLLELSSILYEIHSTILRDTAGNGIQAEDSSPFSKSDFSDFRESIRQISSGQQKSPNILYEVLTNEQFRRYNEVWRAAAIDLLEYQGRPVDYEEVNWGIAKERALCVLNLRGDALDVLVTVEEDMKTNGLRNLHRSLLLKLRSLDGYEGVYNRQPRRKTTEPDPPAEREYSRRTHQPYNQDKERANVSLAYSQVQQDRNSTLIAVVFATTLISIIPIVFAWHRASNKKGSVQDSDFWLLIQSTILQLLGLFTAVFPIHRNSTAHAWKWARAFTALGATCSLVSIPLYLFTPTMWSPLASFFGSCAQAGMALLLALMADSRRGETYHYRPLYSEPRISLPSNLLAPDPFAPDPFAPNPFAPNPFTPSLPRGYVPSEDSDGW